MAAFGRLRRRAELLSGGAPEDYIFPACENGGIDFARHQRTFRYRF
jgi:hypothetical protein